MYAFILEYLSLSTFLPHLAIARQTRIRSDGSVCSEGAMQTTADRRFWLPFTAGAAFSCLIVILLSNFHWQPQESRAPSIDALGKPPVYHASKPNVWKELDHQEVTQLYEFLYEQSTLNLTKEPNGHGKEKYVTEVEALHPNKSDAVAFLNDDGAQPARYARVAVVENNVDKAFICDFKVGPLPPSQETQTVPLTYPHTSGRHCIQTAITDIWGFFVWALSVGYDVADLTSDLLGGKVNLLDPFNPESLYVGARPSLIEDGRMVYWLEFFGNGARSDARSLLPQGLYAKLNISSPSPDAWSVTEWSYNGIIYADVDALRDAWRSPKFTKTSLNQDGRWTDTEDFVSHTAGRSKPPPLSIQPFGPRYKLDRQESFVSWMGFSFYLSTSASRALSLHDIRFNNTRLIYHLGLQEALAHYAGSEPMQAGLEFLDTVFGMGNTMFPLVPGVDCPAYADYLDMTYHKNGQTSVNKNAICVFEYTSDAPLQRHTSAYAVTVSRNTYLVVRSVSTVGNYDYTIDYLFYLDGSVEIKVRASGFIFGAYAGQPAATSEAANDELRSRSSPNPNHSYGYKFHPSVSTSMHDHVLLFRADIDLPNPSSNTFSTVSVEPITTTYEWDIPEQPSRNTMQLTRSPFTHEAGLNWPANSKSMYLLQSNLTNAWGERRSYRIQPGTGIGSPSHLTIINSTSLGNSALWADHDIWVLKQHDNEPLGAHEKNYLDPLDPLVDFSKLANGEELNEEGDDLVVYFNLGGHHVPHSGDIPNTLMHTSASSILFTPFNFFDEDVSLHSRQGVRIDGRTQKGEDGWEKGVRWFGGRYGHKMADEEKMMLDVKRDLEPSVEGYFEQNEQGKVIENKVTGGLLGLFGPREELRERVEKMREEKEGR